jgi:hypothetical protein
MTNSTKDTKLCYISDRAAIGITDEENNVIYELIRAYETTLTGDKHNIIKQIIEQHKKNKEFAVQENHLLNAANHHVEAANTANHRVANCPSTAVAPIKNNHRSVIFILHPKIKIFNII